MIRTIFLISCLTVTIVLAEKPSWYPENINELSKKCYEENQLPADFDMRTAFKQPSDDPKIHNVFLCKAKAMNIYNEETGLDVDRLIYSYYKITRIPKCRKRAVQACVDQHNDVVSKGGMIFKVIKCIADDEEEEIKRRIKNNENAPLEN